LIKGDAQLRKDVAKLLLAMLLPELQLRDKVVGVA